MFIRSKLSENLKSKESLLTLLLLICSEASVEANLVYDRDQAKLESILNLSEQGYIRDIDGIRDSLISFSELVKKEQPLSEGVREGDTRIATRDISYFVELVPGVEDQADPSDSEVRKKHIKLAINLKDLYVVGLFQDGLPKAIHAPPSSPNPQRGTPIPKKGNSGPAPAGFSFGVNYRDLIGGVEHIKINSNDFSSGFESQVIKADNVRSIVAKAAVTFSEAIRFLGLSNAIIAGIQRAQKFEMNQDLPPGLLLHLPDESRTRFSTWGNLVTNYSNLCRQGWRGIGYGL